MTVIKKTNKNYKRSQRGRSMVEILGVLAIIGVLSVGGISAYSAAMAKVKANGLMEATLKEAFLISDQLMMGVITPKLSGFSKSLFDSVSVVPDTNNFELTLKAVDEDICENLKSLLGAISMVQNITDDCLKVTFNKNLTAKKTTQSGGTGGESGGDSGNGNSGDGPYVPLDCSSDPDICSGCQTCQDGKCTDSQDMCAVNSVCSKGVCLCSDNREFCPGVGCCASNQICQYDFEGAFRCFNVDTGDCSSNQDCDTNTHYCNYNTTYQGSACQNKGTLKEISYNNRKFYMGDTYMDWNSAENFCLAHGKRLASSSSLGLSDNFYYSTEECKEYYTACLSWDNENQVPEELYVVESCDECTLNMCGLVACMSDEGSLQMLSSCDECSSGMCGRPIPDCKEYLEHPLYQTFHDSFGSNFFLSDGNIFMMESENFGVLTDEGFFAVGSSAYPLCEDI